MGYIWWTWCHGGLARNQQFQFSNFVDKKVRAGVAKSVIFLVSSGLSDLVGVQQVFRGTPSILRVSCSGEMVTDVVLL